MNRFPDQSGQQPGFQGQPQQFQQQPGQQFQQQPGQPMQQQGFAPQQQPGGFQQQPGFDQGGAAPQQQFGAQQFAQQQVPPAMMAMGGAPQQGGPPVNQMAQIMGQLNDATVFGGGVYALPGHYSLEIKNNKYDHAIQKGWDFHNTSFLIVESTNPHRSAQSSMDWMVSFKNPQYMPTYLGDIKQYLAAACYGLHVERQAVCNRTPTHLGRHHRRRHRGWN